MNDSRLPSWIRSTRDKRPDDHDEATNGWTLTRTKKRARADMESTTAAPSSIEVMSDNPPDALLRRKIRQSSDCLPMRFHGPSRQVSDPESLRSLLSMLKALLTQRSDARGVSQQFHQAFYSASGRGDCGEVSQQECVIMQLLQKIVARCQACPWEAHPPAEEGRPNGGESALSIMCSLPFRSFGGEDASIPGEFCPSNARTMSEDAYARSVVEAVRSVLRACPGQVHHQLCSGAKGRGHKPLRHFLRNHRLLRVVLVASDGNGGPDLFRLFLKSTLGTPKPNEDLRESPNDSREPETFPAYVSDSCGLFPIDHLIRSIGVLLGEWAATNGNENRRSAPSPLLLLEMFLQAVPPPIRKLPSAAGRGCTCSDATPEFQPLIKLVGMAYGDLPSEATIHIIDMLVKWDPGLLSRPSDRSRCLPIHVALDRTSHYLLSDDSGDDSIAQKVIELYGTNNDLNVAVWTHRNRMGELPLHVACRTGVSTRVLQIVVESTLLESTHLLVPFAQGLDTTVRRRVNPWIWTATRGGASPIDLLWNHFVDPSLSIHHQRCSQHLNRLDGYEEGKAIHRDPSHILLGQCIDQWRPNSLSFAAGRRTDISKDYPKDSMKAGNLRSLVIERICLILQASVFDVGSTQSPQHPVGFTSLLQTVSTLCVPEAAGPMIPEALLNLLLDLVVHPNSVEAARRLDERGRSALHCCFVTPIHCQKQVPWRESREHQSLRLTYLQRKIQLWENWIMRLLQRDPALACTPDKDGRLPLHCALLFRRTTRPMLRSDAAEQELESMFASSMDRVVETLWSLCPESAGIRDRRTGQYPFLLAAASTNTVEMMYKLLRRSPPILQLSRLNQGSSNVNQGSSNAEASSFTAIQRR